MGVSTDKIVKKQKTPLGEMKRISVGNILPNTDQPRKYFDEKELKELADSFTLRKDVDDPIIIVPLHSDNRFLIVDGERRWRAAKIAKLDTISCHVRTDIVMDDVFLISVRANLCRANMSPIEEAHAVVRLQAQYKWTQAEVAKNIGKSPGYICQVLKYLDLHQEIQALVICQKLNKGLALQLAPYPADIQLKFLRALEERCEQNGGKPMHPNDAARVLRGEAEKHGVTTKRLKRGKKQASHASLIVSNVLTKAHSFKKALNELTPLHAEKIQKETKVHPLDLLNELRMIHRVLGERIDQLGQAT